MKNKKIVNFNKNNGSENQKLNKNNFFALKYFNRTMTFIILIFLLALYLFIGAIATEWSTWSGIQVASYFFSILTLIILLLACYEILKLYNGNTWQWYFQLYYYILVIIFYLFPIQNPTGIDSYLNFPFYSQIDLSWDQPWVRAIFLIGLLCCYFLVLFANNNNIVLTLKILLFSVYLVIALKALEQFMLSPISGWSSVVWIFLIVICTDTFAFLGGVLYGKHKLAPVISPNKTVEGSITGVVVSTAIGTLFASLMYLYQSTSPWNYIVSNNFSANADAIRYVMYFVLSLICSFIAVLGDLLFSFVKRKNQIKDFGTLLPGHGGVLDRLDSLSLVLVVMWFITIFV